jgi:hypothetical protein
VVRWHAGSTDLVVVGGAGGGSSPAPAAVLAVLRESGVASIDLLVVADPNVSAGLVGAIEARHPMGAVVVAGGVGAMDTESPQVIAPRPRSRLEVGSLDVQLTATADRLVVEARPIRAGRSPR